MSMKIQALWQVAERFAKSGPFENASPAQLYARILTGAALGIDPATACGNISHSHGKPVFTAALQAALLARSGLYWMKIKELSDERCELQFFWQIDENVEHELGTSIFTIAEAKRAGLTNKDVWMKYPSDLLFARALTRGIKRYAPDLLVGSAAVTAEELGADTHEPLLPATGAPPVAESKPAPPESKPKRGTVTDQQLHDLKCLKELLTISQDAWRQILAKRGVVSASELSTEQAAKLISALKTKLDNKSLEEGLAQSNGELIVTLPGNRQKEAGPTPASKSEK
jgi:hypothetical protein